MSPLHELGFWILAKPLAAEPASRWETGVRSVNLCTKCTALRVYALAEKMCAFMLPSVLERFVLLTADLLLHHGNREAVGLRIMLASPDTG